MKCRNRVAQWFVVLILNLMTICVVTAKTHFVGPQENYQTIEQAAPFVVPGDSIVVRDGIYQQRENLTNLQGNVFHHIVIMAETPGLVSYQGGSEAWHLSDCAYLKIVGFEFVGQTANGVNIDDNGSIETPTHHIIIEHCVFRDMNASGNNDLLKLSGLDHFRISFCTFLNGAGGGSGIDMVGCHYGKIQGNLFENMGSNGIQAKGGTHHVVIEQNKFTNAGMRSVNLGGSTGLAFFRPLDAPFEAADLVVRANVFEGSDAPIAFVGSTRIVVENNTIIEPEVWIYRILQETVDTSRFVSCGDNIFRNNLVYVDDRLRRDFNIGPNTRPESFLFENNWWYNASDLNWGGPDNPGVEIGAMSDIDPQFLDLGNRNYELQSRSPAVGAGRPQDYVRYDRNGKRYGERPTVGAFEAGPSATSSFAPVGAEWYYDELHNIQHYLGYYRLVVSRDTLIDLRTAQVIDYYEGDSNGEEMRQEGQLVVMGEGPEVYLYAGDDYEPLYSFSEGIGTQDGFTVKNRYHNPHEEFIVGDYARFTFELELDSIMEVTGVELKCYTPSELNTDTAWLTYGRKVVERIGPLDQSLIARQYPMLLGGFYGELRCYSDEEIMYNPRGIKCDSVKTKTSYRDIDKEEVEIAYRLISQELVIHSEEDFILESFTMYGQRLTKESFQAGKTVLHLKAQRAETRVYRIHTVGGEQKQMVVVVHP